MSTSSATTTIESGTIEIVMIEIEIGMIAIATTMTVTIMITTITITTNGWPIGDCDGAFVRSHEMGMLLTVDHQRVGALGICSRSEARP